MSAFAEFEKQLIAAIESIRSDVANLTSENYLNFNINAAGRANDGDIEVNFKIGETYHAGTASGGNLEAVLDEFIRRNSWQKRHAPLCLPKVAPAQQEGEAPTES